MLYAFSSFLENNSPNKGFANALKIGAGVSFVWGGISLQQAASEYTKEQKLIIKNKIGER